MSYKVPSLQNFEWQQAVDDRTTTPTGSEIKGYRYIITTGTGDFSGYNNYIATSKVSNPSSSSDWNFDAPTEGMITYVKDEDILYIYISSWDIFSLGDFAPNDAKYLVGNTSDVSGLDNEILSKDVGLENLILNGSFEHWYSGTSVAPDGWTKSGVGSVSRESSTIKLGTYSMKLDNVVNLKQIISTTKGINYYKGRTVTISCWVNCSTANRACIYIFDGTAISGYIYHSGSGNWELLTATLDVSSSATEVSMQIDIRNSTGIGYFDGAMMVEGSVPFAYKPHVEEHLYEQQVTSISPMDVISSTSDDAYNGLVNFQYLYGYSKVLNKGLYIPIPINTAIAGKPIIVDSIVINYNTQDNASYIDWVGFNRWNSSGSISGYISHTADLGNGTSGNGSHDIVDSPVELVDGCPLYIVMTFLGETNVTDVRLFSIVFKYHVKVHG